MDNAHAPSVQDYVSIHLRFVCTQYIYICMGVNDSVFLGGHTGKGDDGVSRDQRKVGIIRIIDPISGQLVNFFGPPSGLTSRLTQAEDMIAPQKLEKNKNIRFC